MLLDVQQYLKHGYCQSSWSWKMAWSHTIRRFNRHSQRLHTSHTKAHVIFSGIQPTGVPHLGIIWVLCSNGFDFKMKPHLLLDYSTPSLTCTPLRPTRRQIRCGGGSERTLATLLAMGVDPERSTIFYQSAVWFPDTAALLFGAYVLRICRFRSTQS